MKKDLRSKVGPEQEASPIEFAEIQTYREGVVRKHMRSRKVHARGVCVSSTNIQLVMTVSAKKYKTCGISFARKMTKAAFSLCRANAGTLLSQTLMM